MDVQCDDLRQCHPGGFLADYAQELGRLGLVWTGCSIQYHRLVDFWTKLGPGAQWVFISHPSRCTFACLHITSLPISPLLAYYVAAGWNHCHGGVCHQKFDPVLWEDGLLFPAMEWWGTRSCWSKIHRARAG